MRARPFIWYNIGDMIDFIKETLLLLPFLFVTYLVLEAVEAHAGGALERWLERAKSVGPLAGALLARFRSAAYLPQPRRFTRAVS